MPYVFYEEIPEELEEADVVERTEYEQLKEDFEAVQKQRDEAIERAETAEAGWEKAREKYANAFLTTPSRVKEEHSGESEKLTAQTINSLFTIN